MNYLGQGALVLADPTATGSVLPARARLGPDPDGVLATLATVIASQAVITGAFSLTRQAIQLGLLPRLEIRHTSEAHPGQIYLPRVNGLLLVGVDVLVLVFRSSSDLARAYGIAVTGAMVVDRDPRLHRDLARLALVPRGGSRDAALPRDRSRLLRRQHPEDLRGRLRAAADRPAA